MPTFEVGYCAEKEIGKLRDERQDRSFRCVSEGGTADIELSILATTKKNIQLSQRDAYSQIFQPSGGASPRDFYKLANKVGICEDRFCPSYPSDGSAVQELWTRQRGSITPKRLANALQWKIGAYRSIVSMDLEVMAQAIFENKGCGGAYKPLNGQMGHFIFFNGYGIHKGYQGLKYRDSYPPYEKWIVKHKGQFYYASTNMPLAVPIRLYSIWTAEAGNWLKKNMTKSKLNFIYEELLLRPWNEQKDGVGYLNHNEEFVREQIGKIKRNGKLTERGKIIKWVNILKALKILDK